jgi:hypothetical protein
MNSKVLTVVGIVVLGLGALAATTPGCGSSSGGAGDFASVCAQGCPTIVKCSGGVLTMSACLTSCTAKASCSNASAILAGSQKCVGMTDCTAAGACAAANIPDCATGAGGSTSAGSAGSMSAGNAGSTGSAGSTGGAGSTGSAGSTTGGGGQGGGAGLLGTAGNFGIAGVGGTTCDTACMKADACCKALPGANAANCTFKMMCDAATAANMSQIVSGCNFILTEAAALGANAPAACK